MKSDILTLLRIPWYSDDYGVSKDDLCNERNKQATTAAHEIERLRTELKDAKARNTLYLSRLQEHEAREQ